MTNPLHAIGFYKVVSSRAEDRHRRHGPGLNECSDWNPEPVEDGGVTFTSKDVLAFTSPEADVYEVEVPEGIPIVRIEPPVLKFADSYDPVEFKAPRVTLTLIGKAGDPETIRHLAEEGVDLNVRAGRPLRQAIQLAHTGSHLPKRTAYREIAKILLGYGADVHRHAEEVFRYAALVNNLDLVQLLLDHDANVNACDGEALRMATCQGYAPLVALLLKYGANPLAKRPQRHIP